MSIPAASNSPDIVIRTGAHAVIVDEETKPASRLEPDFLQLAKPVGSLRTQIRLPTRDGENVLEFKVIDTTGQTGFDRKRKRIVNPFLPGGAALARAGFNVELEESAALRLFGMNPGSANAADPLNLTLKKGMALKLAYRNPANPALNLVLGLELDGRVNISELAARMTDLARFLARQDRMNRRDFKLYLNAKLNALLAPALRFGGKFSFVYNVSPLLSAGLNQALSASAGTPAAPWLLGASLLADLSHQTVRLNARIGVELYFKSPNGNVASGRLDRNGQPDIYIQGRANDGRAVTLQVDWMAALFGDAAIDPQRLEKLDALQRRGFSPYQAAGLMPLLRHIGKWPPDLPLPDPAARGRQLRQPLLEVADRVYAARHLWLAKLLPNALADSPRLFNDHAQATQAVRKLYSQTLLQLGKEEAGRLADFLANPQGVNWGLEAVRQRNLQRYGTVPADARLLSRLSSAPAKYRLEDGEPTRIISRETGLAYRLNFFRDMVAPYREHAGLLRI
ncbi:hypothetical protein SAMN06265795_103197 [Noviherbaspirillum humi]|uniref:Uncharacterized protein n=1 Tax=Noviherbaspirillum humi TaxID=1688639 RepID=A0A239F7G7_9BURK|nr:hypothetical protein [Noviherbaspirillum humi]SNS52233.1 hypothetical protein SAMN06265795_103197 [Noviherbaspirillum humi]